MPPQCSLPAICELSRSFSIQLSRFRINCVTLPDRRKGPIRMSQADDLVTKLRSPPIWWPWDPPEESGRPPRWVSIHSICTPLSLPHTYACPMKAFAVILPPVNPTINASDRCSLNGRNSSVKEWLPKKLSRFLCENLDRKKQIDTSKMEFEASFPLSLCQGGTRTH